MKIWWSILLTLFVVTNAIAHQPDISSTMLIQKPDKSWVLQIRAALTAFEYSIREEYGEESFVSPNEFKALVKELVKANTQLNTTDQLKVALDTGYVKLGHESNAIFKVTGLPSDFETITVRNTIFEHISRNQSAFIVLKEGMSKTQFILDNGNDHTASLKVVGDEFELVQKEVKTLQSNVYLYMMSAVGLFLVGAWFFLNNSRKIN